jgi:hypothetical protein
LTITLESKVCIFWLSIKVVVVVVYINVL